MICLIKLKNSFLFSVSLLRQIISMAQNEQQRFVNRLANEKSSYLQQHAHNPVNW
jgi:hypothetical protein